MEKRICLNCGEPIIGRSDKKFCNDFCRNNYNNHRKKDTVNLMRNINNILRSNRHILANLNPSGKAKVSKRMLLDKGFNFSYHTNAYTTKKGNRYYFVYDQGFLPLEGDYFALVRRQEYVG